MIVLSKTHVRLLGPLDSGQYKGLNHHKDQLGILHLIIQTSIVQGSRFQEVLMFAVLRLRASSVSGWRGSQGHRVFQGSIFEGLTSSTLRPLEGCHNPVKFSQANAQNPKLSTENRYPNPLKEPQTQKLCTLQFDI